MVITAVLKTFFEDTEDFSFEDTDSYKIVIK